jgi:hypothetical protein
MAFPRGGREVPLQVLSRSDGLGLDTVLVREHGTRRLGCARFDLSYNFRRADAGFDRNTEKWHTDRRAEEDAVLTISVGDDRLNAARLLNLDVPVERS